MSIVVLGKYQDYVPCAFLAPHCTRIMLRRDKIIRMRDQLRSRYMPANCIQLPPEIIYMIATMAPIEFAKVSHEFYNEFRGLAESSWQDIVTQRFVEKAKININIWVPLQFWLRDAQPILFAYIPYVGCLRYSS